MLTRQRLKTTTQKILMNEKERTKYFENDKLLLHQFCYDRNIHSLVVVGGSDGGLIVFF